ncbi:YLP motif containing 1 [Nesidiocoris tenuis]|uniref:YLP motif containing 1 n=1 Tax=Nesidiocoris tenuis TaxID=355587 RepID=A0ABN7B9U4_9HEMI|nr:YLP motif containing 1 [Nesidiocoris tenuis]
MAWNQQAAWSVQATPAYAVPGGYAATLAAANAAAAAPAAAGVAAGAYAAVQGYGQWPAYGGAAPAAAAAAVPAAAIASWPQAAAAGPSVQQQQQQQQWEQWTQWQQQYAQWQQQYGKDYMAAMQASGQTAVLPGMPIATIGSGAPLTPALPSGAPPTTPAAPPLPASPPPPQPGAPKRPLEGKNGGNASKKSKTEIDEGIQTIKNSLAEMAEAEKQFDEQFNSWENQFNSWKKENANHPDTDQYQAYEAKWTSWRNQLLQRREQMKKKKDAKMAELEKLQEEKKALEMPPMSAPVVPAALDTYGQSYGNLSAAQGFPGSQVYQVGPNSPLFPETAAKASAAAVPSAENALTAVNQTTFTTSINTYTSQAGGSIPSVCGSVSASGVSAIPVLGETAPSSGGIPGLDLIDSSGAKPSPYIVPTSISVSVGSTNKPIETPTDSEPFNFPQPKNAGWPQMPPMSGPPPGMGGPPMGMPPMSGPPPGFMGMPPPMGNHMGPPPQFNQNQPPPMGKDSPNSGRPNHFQPGQGPDLNQPPPFNDGTGRGGWAPNDDESRNFGKFPNNQGPGRNSGPPFSTDKRPPWAPAGKAGLLPTPVMSNSFGNKPGPKDDVNDEIDDPYADERWEQMAEEDRASETSENQRGGPGPGMRGPPPRNSYGGQFNDQMRPGGPFNNQMRGQFDGPPPGQFGGPGPMRGGFNRPSLLSMPGGPPNQQRPQFNQQGPYSNQQGPYPHQQGPPPNQQGPHPNQQGPRPNQQGPYPHQQGPHPNQQGPHPNQQGPHPNQQGPHPNQQGPLHNQQGPHPNQQGPHPNQQGPHPNQRGPPNQSGGPLPLMSLPLEHLAPKGQPLGPPDETLPKLLPGDKPTSDQCPPGQAPTEILENKQPAQPVFEAEVIIDYRHRPAEIGFPDMFEADSMADYAHGANDMTEIMNADIHQDQSRPYDRVQPGWHAPGLNRGNPPPRGRDDFMDRDRRDFPRDWPPRGFESPRDRFDDRRVRDLDRHRRSPPRRSVEEERFVHIHSKMAICSNLLKTSRIKKRSREAARDHHEKRSRDDRRPPSQPAVENRPPSRPADQSEPAAPAGAANSVQQVKTFPIADLLLPPGRNSRPPRILIVLRGLPGSGKSYVAKLIKEKEVEMGGTAPRILSIDDYFMVETEKEEVDPETNRKVTKKVMEYEHEAGMETSYQNSLIKAFRKTVSDGYFPFIIVDSPHSKTSNYEDIVGFGKQKGFQVYICEMESDLNECFKRNIHGRTLDDIEKMGKIWEKTPPNEVILDIRSLLQEAAITEVDMEDTVEETTSDEAAQKAEEGNEAPKADENESSAPKSNGGSEIEATAADDPKKAEEAKEEDDDVEEVSVSGFFTAANRSKWDDLDSSTNKLDRLDGLAKARTSTTIKDWLQLPEDYFEARSSAAAVSGGKKRVRWADLEERYEQEKMRAIGFVVGQTDWNRMLDPTGGQSALTQTKYI